MRPDGPAPPTPRRCRSASEAVGRRRRLLVVGAPDEDEAAFESGAPAGAPASFDSRRNDFSIRTKS